MNLKETDKIGYCEHKIMQNFWRAGKYTNGQYIEINVLQV